ncbi:MAG: hypothetical protein Q7R98_02305 [Candidatus Jorgensenbacteria bacterium]|nr:hypothetical protein [Candidatus Jorgensenbacteria bacterium]
MNWLKENWFKIGLLALVLIGIFVFKNGNFSQNDNYQAITQTGDLKFDIDLNKLNYSLPVFTKICIPSSKQYCQSGINCSSMKPSVFLLIDEIQNKYYRCDNKPCDKYDYFPNPSGIYNIIRPLPPKHGEIKLSNDGSYYEVVSLGLDLFISYGTCQNIK